MIAVLLAAPSPSPSDVTIDGTPSEGQEDLGSGRHVITFTYTPVPRAKRDQNTINARTP